MRRMALMAGVLALGATGCGGARTSYVRSSDTVLGRVVIYRNGVAYFERSATSKATPCGSPSPPSRSTTFCDR